MSVRRISAIGLIAALGFGTAACTDGYGYSGVELGYSSPGYYDGGYYDGGYGGGFASSYYGWYGDYYYPGSGYYVYDRDRRAHRWNQGQQRYWYDRGRQYRGERRQNWQGFGNRREERSDWNRGDRRGPDGAWDRPERRERGDWNRGERRGGDRSTRRDRRD